MKVVSVRRFCFIHLTRLIVIVWQILRANPKENKFAAGVYINCNQTVIVVSPFFNETTYNVDTPYQPNRARKIVERCAIYLPGSWALNVSALRARK